MKNNLFKQSSFPPPHDLSPCFCIKSRGNCHELSEFFGNSCHRWCYRYLQDLLLTYSENGGSRSEEAYVFFFGVVTSIFQRLTRFSWSGTDSKWYYATCCLEGDCTISFIGSNHHSRWLIIYLFISYSSAQPNDKAFVVLTRDKERITILF